MNQRKIYYSFHDVPLKKNHISPAFDRQAKISFSKSEIIHIIIAIAVLTISFAFAFADNPPLLHLDSVLGRLPLSFLAILTAFVCHEMAHKFVGQKFGYWSEFRMYPTGLLLAFFLAIFTGFVFAAPGAVQIYGMPTREESGKMALAGPLTNLIIALIFLVITFGSTFRIGELFFFIAYINIFLAFFNLLPFGPMDGLKIFSWKKEVWVGMIILCGILFFLSVS